MDGGSEGKASISGCSSPTELVVHMMAFPLLQAFHPLVILHNVHPGLPSSTFLSLGSLRYSLRGWPELLWTGAD